MADYNITVQFASVGLGGAMTAGAIRDALETLTLTNRLDASAIQNLPNAGDALTIAQIVSGISALTGDDRLSATKLRDLIKTIVLGVEKALNFIAEGDIYSAAFRAIYSCNSMLAGDYYIAKDIDGAVNGDFIENGDWVISVVNAPSSSNYTDPTKWRVLKLSHLPTRDPAFRKNNDKQTGSGIMPYDVSDYLSGALALYSFVTGYDCVIPTTGIGSIAMGVSSVASRPGTRSFASGKFANRGDAQVWDMVMHLETTNDTPHEFILPAPIILNQGKTYDFKIRVVARNISGSINKSWEFKALIATETTPVFSSPVILATGIDNLTCWLSYNTSTKKLSINCIGLSTPASIRWVAHIEALEVYNNAGGINVNEITGIVTGTYID